MISRVRTQLAKREEGFTLVELLVVIVIIAILVAIAIPSFLAFRQRGWDSQVRSDLRNAATAAEAYASANNGSFLNLDNDAAGGTPANSLQDFGFRPTAGVTVTVVTANANGYTFSATHANRGADTWGYNSNTGTITGP